MDLRQLKYFQMVSQLGSVTKAAEQLHIAQPAISMAIQKLERELDVTLFDRSQKHFTLTPEGSIFLKRIEDILTRLQDTVIEINDYKTLAKGTIKIGITPIIGAFLFPRLFAEFQKAFPYFEPSFVEQGSLNIRSRLEKGDLDIGILITSKISPKLATLPITTCQILVCYTDGHPLSGAKSVAFDELRNYPFIMFREDTYSRKMILEECASYGFKPNIVFSSSQIETVLGLVEQGIGITFLPDAIACKHPNIKFCSLAKPLSIQAGLAWNKERYLSSAAKSFIDFVSKTFFRA